MGAVKTGGAPLGSQSQAATDESKSTAMQSGMVAYQLDAFEVSVMAEQVISRGGGRKPTAKSVRTVAESRSRWGIGFVLALAAGLLFGCTFDVPLLLMQCAKDLRRHPGETPEQAGVICHFRADHRFSQNPF